MATLFAVLAIAGGSNRIFALDAKQVFDIVSPSTVFIEDVDSFGSGVFLNEKGLILTNYHVVAANISLKVRARVRFGNRVVLTEIDDVKVTKIHKAYDLALLEVKPPQNGTFIPARIIPMTPPLTTGIRCYAVGNPGGPDGRALELSITEGLVSAAFRKMDDLEYTQVSAQINPGNSGGPICDELGRVFGIATWKMTDTEGIGFAIPTQRINMAHFVDPKMKEPDTALAMKAAVAAKKYYDLARGAEGRDRQMLLAVCAEAYRVEMLANPGVSTPYSNLCVIYRELGRLDLGRKYAEAAIRVEPNSAHACHMFGLTQVEQNPGNKELEMKTVEVWFRGILGRGSANDKMLCITDVIVAMMNNAKWAAAAYMIQWADQLGATVDMRKADRSEWGHEVAAKLSPAELASVRSKKSDFSKADFESLLGGKSVGDIMPLVAADPSTAMISQNASVTRPTASSQQLPAITADQMTGIVKDAAAKFAASQVPVPPAGLECALPDTAEKAVLAYAGWKVVVSFPDLMKLGVFNVATAKLDGFIDCADRRVLLAAGGQLLAMYTPSNLTLEIYDLATLQKIGSKTLPSNERVAFVAMGLLNPTRVFVLQEARAKANEGGWEIYRPSMLGIPNLNSVELLPEIKDGNNPLVNLSRSQDGLTGGMDEAGNVATVSGNGSGIASYTMHADNRLDFAFYPSLGNRPSPVQGAKFVICRRDSFDPETKGDPYSKVRWGGVSPYFLAPVAGYPAFAALEHASTFYGFRVIGVPAMNVLATLPLDADQRSYMTHAESRAQVETMLASAYCDRIVYLLPAEKKIILFPLGLKSGSAGSGFAEAGKHFERKLNIAAGSTVTIQSGPQGLTYEPKSGALVWDVPANVKTGQMVQVIMLVQGADKKESYVVEKISIP